MIEHWERTQVTGHGPEGAEVTETVVHRRGEDVLGMAMRRNPEMAGCSRFEIRTEEAFSREKAEEPRRTQADIPRDDRQGEELEW